VVVAKNRPTCSEAFSTLLMARVVILMMAFPQVKILNARIDAMANTGSERRPIFMLSTEGKSREQMKAEAREALRRYQESLRQQEVEPAGRGVDEIPSASSVLD
jgi:hypothetical protein